MHHAEKKSWGGFSKEERKLTSIAPAAAGKKQIVLLTGVT